MPSVRTFIAVELPEEVRAYLAKIHNRLHQALGESVRWVAPQAVHLTIKFLGDVEADRLPPLEERMGHIAQEHQSFRLTLGRPGCFPNLQQPRVLWVGIQGELERLVQLQAGIEEALRSVGFSPEGRAFSPHLTLGRLRDGVSREERRRVGEVVASLEVGPGPAFQATSVSLMRSQLTPRGAIYTRLAMGPLQGGREQLEEMPKG